MAAKTTKIEVKTTEMADGAGGGACWGGRGARPDRSRHPPHLPLSSAFLVVSTAILDV